jgi:hypothetical protein
MTLQEVIRMQISHWTGLFTNVWEQKRARLRYEDFKQKNQDFLTAVKVARHKVVSHSDQNTYKQDERVGAYVEGLDDQYFDSLHTLISECYQDQSWGPLPRVVTIHQRGYRTVHGEVMQSLCWQLSCSTSLFHVRR